ncbi:MAG: tRNA (adenosine(37)-N6)-threonylcarbamoyltransferase complex dimerization subunit type 1 TsaB [Gemmatimonadaceae bacterium]
MITLALDASTYVGTVAVIRDGCVVAEGETAMRGRDIERLMPAVAAALDAAGVTAAQVGRVVCGDGPGSFTSLRIAASIAKGLATGNGAALMRVSSLALVAAGAPALTPGAYVAVLDALRGDVYFQRLVVGPGGDVVPDHERALGPVDAVPRMAQAIGARVVGPAAVLDLLPGVPREGAGSALELAPHARGVIRLEAALQMADLASWEPRYGRLAEAQVKWEAVHGRPLPAS